MLKSSIVLLLCLINLPVLAQSPHREAIVVARGILDVEGGIVQLAADRDGTIREVRVEEGQQIRRGDVLAVQDDRLSSVQIDVARAELGEKLAEIGVLETRLAGARRERDRVAPLMASGTAPRRQFDERETEVDVLTGEIAVKRAQSETMRAKLAAAQLENDLRTIRAPADGVIVRRLARPGDGVSVLQVTPLFWFAPTTTPLVRAEMEELLTTRLAEGLEADIVLEADERHTWPGVVTRVGRAFGPRRLGVFDPRERADVRVLEVIVRFKGEPPSLPLGSRMLVRLRTMGN